jgi:hypothetical protein
MRARLAHVLRGRSWLAYPLNESDMRQRFSAPKPIAVHLVKDARQYDSVAVRFDGNAWWFEDPDTRSDPRAAEHLREAQRALTLPEELHFKDMTPEMRTAYAIGVRSELERNEKALRARDRKRVGDALALSGGGLREMHDRGDYWQVEWATADGAVHTSAITKADLTVLSSGICLSGRDRDFDLQSLVGVVTGRDF